jgi:histidyl-tRNA synthetase
VYPDAKKLGTQLAYAERKGFAIALIAGDTERADGTWKVKNLGTRAEQTVADADLVATVAALIG